MLTSVIQRLSPKLVALTLLLASLTACSPRFEIYHAELTGTEYTDGQPTYRDSLVEVAYEFWSPGGVPFIAVYNHAEDTLLLDLRASGALVDGELVGLDARYDRLAELRRGEDLYLSLAPATWTSFEGYPLAEARTPGRKGEVGEPHHRLAYSFTFVAPDGVHRVRQEIVGSLVQEVGVADMEAFEGQGDHSAYYFHDRYFVGVESTDESDAEGDGEVSLFDSDEDEADSFWDSDDEPEDDSADEEEPDYDDGNEDWDYGEQDAPERPVVEDDPTPPGVPDESAPPPAVCPPAAEPWGPESPTPEPQTSESTSAPASSRELLTVPE